MIDSPLLLKPESVLQEAARLFLENDISCAPVVDDNNNLIGVFGKKQLFQAAADGHDFSSNLIKDYMALNPIALKPHDDIKKIRKTEVNVPPLRERREEIPALVYHIIKKLNNRYGLNKAMDEKLIDRLINYDWPGNVRELENIIERAYVTIPGNTIKDVKFESSDTNQGNISLLLSDEPKLKKAVQELEKTLILNSLKRHGSTRKAAVILGVSQPTVCRKAARYGIRLEDYE